jgi:hypothetical protein
MKKAYECPNCHQSVTVDESFKAPTLVCSGCWQEFNPANEEVGPPVEEIVLPSKLPFFKSGRKNILSEKLHELNATGELSSKDEKRLEEAALRLGLTKVDLEDIEKDEFFKEFEPIKKRMESSWHFTDEDAAEIEVLKKRFGITNFKMEGTAPLFRAIYLLEVKGQLPAPISTSLMLNGNEVAYFSIPTTWHQTRVTTKGYSGSSFSVPTGIKGVRFRFGGYTPVKSEELKPLASGTLFVTSQRLLFNGDSRNTSVALKKIVDGHIFTDSVKIEKSTGKPDYFSMNAAEARHVLALIGALRV